MKVTREKIILDARALADWRWRQRASLAAYCVVLAIEVIAAVKGLWWAWCIAACLFLAATVVRFDVRVSITRHKNEEK